METKAFDFKKADKEIYNPKGIVHLNIPEMTYIMVDGSGDPNNNPSYQEAIAILYCLSYTIKMSKMGNEQPEGYFDYVVPPLEGLWSVSDNHFDINKRDNWVWNSIIRVPDFVTEEVFTATVEKAKKKKPELNFARARLEKFSEGLVVQALHIGPFSTEEETMAKMKKYMLDNNLIDNVGPFGKHHELYLSDPRKTAPEKLKTILRHPVIKK